MIATYPFRIKVKIFTLMHNDEKYIKDLLNINIVSNMDYA